MRAFRGVPQIGGIISGVAYKKDYSILGGLIGIQHHMRVRME